MCCCTSGLIHTQSGILEALMTAHLLILFFVHWPSIHPFINLYIHLSIHQFIHIFIHPSLHLFIYLIVLPHYTEGSLLYRWTLPQVVSKAQSEFAGARLACRSSAPPAATERRQDTQNTHTHTLHKHTFKHLGHWESMLLLQHLNV